MRKIKQTSTGVTVVSDRGTVKAKRVIVAVPPPLALGIDWSPLLPPRRLQLLQHMPMGTLMKVDAVYAKPFWRAKGLSGSATFDNGVVRTMFDNCPADAKVGVLLAFIGGSSWQQCAMLPLAERRKLVLAAFAKVGGARGAQPDRVRRARLDPRTLDDGQPGGVGATRGHRGVRINDPAAVRASPLGRHRDIDLLGRLHGRRRTRRRARCCRGREAPLSQANGRLNTNVPEGCSDELGS